MKWFLCVAALLLASTVHAQITEGQVQVAGLTCSMCFNGTERALKTLPFIATVKADLNENVFHLTFKPGEAINPDAIPAAIEDAGFSVLRLELTARLPVTGPLAKDTHISLGGQTYHLVGAVHAADAPVRLLLLDKNLAQAKTHKTYAGFTGLQCYETGRAQDGCCPPDAHTQAGVKHGSRIFHVALL